MMGANLPTKEPAAVEVKTEEVSESDNEKLIPVSEDDIYINDDEMILTIDCSRVDEIDDGGEGVEFILTNGGSVLSVMKEGRPKPVRKYNIGKVVKSIDEWSLNNGILDMTLKI
jgi:hypothetical protein